ncbi:MAG: TonB-dependent receptor domain-containing protein, partial [Bacteroidota bacterium]
VRNDYSSRFAKDNRSGVFPAVSVGWRINQEQFLADVDAISNLKLRAGYGITGQQDITENPYPYLATYTESTSTASYQLGGQFYPTLRPNAYDARIKWEETTTINAGLDFGFAKDRISGSIDVYERETVDLINQVPIPAGSNFSNDLITNVGTLENKGYEITLNADVISRPDFNWNVGVNFTHNENEITKLQKTDDPNYPGVADGGISGGVGNNIQINSIGHAARAFYVFEQVYDGDGKPIEGLYIDRSGLGGSVVSSENNKYHYNKPAANYLIGINTRLNYKGFDFSFSSRLSLGNYVYNNVFSSNAIYSALYYQSGVFSNVPTAIKDTGFHAQQLWSDYYVEDASFFKLDNISAGYSFNNLMGEKLKARVSFTVQNAWVVTDYSGIDPEVSNGIDNNIYPRPRTFLFGINLTY